MRCDQLTDSLSDAADGAVLLDAAGRAHVEQCLRCQAELVQYRKLLRALRAMRTEVLEPAPGLLPEVLASLEEAAERRRRCAACSAVAGSPTWAVSPRPRPRARRVRSSSPPALAAACPSRAEPPAGRLDRLVCSMFGAEGRLLSCPFGPDSP